MDRYIDQIDQQILHPLGTHPWAAVRACAHTVVGRWVDLRVAGRLDRWFASARASRGASRAFDAFLRVPIAPRPPRSQPLVVHVIGSLAAGGAERQLLYVARESRRAHAIDARILTMLPLEGANAHYRDLADEDLVPVATAGHPTDPATLQELNKHRRGTWLLARLHPAERAWSAELYAEFIRLRPDVVHLWLDGANVWGGAAALAAGVPRIVLSTRNVNPTHFPAMDCTGFLPWYQRFATDPRVRWIGNSRAGIADYAAWIGMDPSRFHLVLNAFDPRVSRMPDSAQITQTRNELAPHGAALVAGVFRLADEKEPRVFVDAARQVLRERPETRIVIAGDGPLRSTIAAMIADEPRITLLGRIDDVAPLLCAADVVMHASRVEGTPNALLEAQAFGCPVVATRAGGTSDAVDHGCTGMLVDVGDANHLALHTLEILRDPALRARLSIQGPPFIAKRFSVSQMVTETVRTYDFQNASVT